MEKENWNFILMDVLQQLRRRLIVVLSLYTVSSIMGYFAAEPVMKGMFKMVRQVVFISPTEAFVTKLKVALAIGFVLVLPVLLYLIVSSAIRREKDISRSAPMWFALGSYALFLAGGAFCFYAILPAALTFLLGFATLEMQPLLSAGRYISFVLISVMMFGLAFELPVAMLLLARIGVLDENTLKQKRRYAVLGIFVVAGVLTPSPDVLSQILMAIPLLGLYEAGIFLIRFCAMRKVKNCQMPADQQQLYM
jgi:sec-independent protein translocase protein TatC